MCLMGMFSNPAKVTVNVDVYNLKNKTHIDILYIHSVIHVLYIQ